MTLDDLRCLIAVHECKSFSGAARRLGCSQPAVSQHIQRLERELRLRLFERQARRIVATAAGEVVVRAATASLSTLDHAMQRVAALRDGEAGSLVVTTGGTSVQHFMRGAIKSFRRDFPRVKLQFRGAMSSAECIELLFREAIDLAFVTIAGDTEGIREVPLVELDYVFLTGKHHALARRSTLGLQDLNGVECIGLIEGRTARNQLSAALARHGVSLETAMTVYDWDTAIHLVELGLGSAIVPSWHAHTASTRASLVTIPISGLAPMRVGWAVRDSHELHKPAQEFMRLLAHDLRARPVLPGVRLVR